MIAAMASPDVLHAAPTSRGDTTQPPPVRHRPLLRMIPELGALVVVAALWPATGSLASPAGGPGPGFVPRLLLTVLAVCAVTGLLREVVRRRSGATVAARSASPADDDAGPTDLRRALLGAALVVGYVAATAVAGFVIASTVFAAGFLWLSGHRRARSLVAVAGVAPLALAYVFVKVVYIALPTGLGPFDAVTVALYTVFGIY